jgi:expansin (peptidoglycan-binding protein)
MAAAAGSAVAVVLAVVVTVALAAGSGPAGCTAPVMALLPLAAVPAGTGFRAGVATFYGKDAVSGACSFVEKAPGGYTAALGPDEYAAGAACGMTLEVKGRRGTVRVKVTNLCPECPRGHLDLTNEAFAKVDDLAKGKVAISYRAVDDPALPGPLTVRVKEGSSQWWLALLVDRHGNALRSVEVSGGATWKALSRTDYNYWLAPSGAGKGPFSVRVTDVRGHRVTVRGIALRPGLVQRSTVLMYPSSASGSVPTGTGSPTRSTTVARSASRTASASPSPRPTAPTARSVTPTTGTTGTAAPSGGPLTAATAAAAPSSTRCG